MHSPSTWQELEATVSCGAQPLPALLFFDQKLGKGRTVLHSVEFTVTYCTDPEVDGALAGVPVCQCLGRASLPDRYQTQDPARVPSSLASAIRRLTCESSTDEQKEHT